MTTSTNAPGKTLVVIVNFRSAALSAECSRPISDAEVIVVDNTGEESEQRILEEAKLQGLFSDVIYSPENVGFGAAVNIAVSQSAVKPEDTLIILNPDITISLRSFQELVRISRANPDSIVSPKIYANWGGRTRVWYLGGVFDWRAVRVRMRPGFFARRTRGPLVDCTFITGACFAVSASTFHSLGGFDDRFFLYWEDVDLSIRAKRSGISLVCAPGVTVHHQVSGTQRGKKGERGASYFYYMQLNRFTLMDKYGIPARNVLTTGLAQTLHPFLLALFQRGSRLTNLKASVAGLRDGLKGIRS